MEVLGYSFSRYDFAANGHPPFAHSPTYDWEFCLIILASEPRIIDVYCDWQAEFMTCDDDLGLFLAGPPYPPDIIAHLIFIQATDHPVLHDSAWQFSRAPRFRSIRKVLRSEVQATFSVPEGMHRPARLTGTTAANTAIAGPCILMSTLPAAACLTMSSIRQSSISEKLPGGSQAVDHGPEHRFFRAREDCGAMRDVPWELGTQISLE